MGFLNDLIQAIQDAHATKFGGVTLRMAKVSDFDPAGLARFLEKNEHKKLEPLGRLADACDLMVISQQTARTPEYAFIARASVKGAALVDDGKEDKGLAYRADWLSSRTASGADALRVVLLEGDGMHPTLCQGDQLLVDQGAAAKALVLDKVYLVSVSGHIYVKRFRSAPGRLLFMGDNRERAYEDLEIRPGEEGDFAVIGRVLWAGKEL
ncbi:MAG: S24 family peptidase [Holophaga sp.]|nr:S24 family peptidase [Holophaga sp.]